ncbi:SusC/RagA family TonB-linked outer membrane protein [Botryobacter ruber]|uniref:SusC/RagA family TonB-linked outer membrane protein n=1 Tax=Botryobacter ruber TaxID=2171629 RepID=UPI000E0B053E|nr:TonB-dependent receptor [Botryobacter ruber]
MKNYLLLVLCLFSFHVLFAQENITVRGKVTDASDGQPLIGAGVQIKGTTQGTVTDIDGNYELQNVPPNATLVISYVGYSDQEHPVNNRAVINAQLGSAISELEQVVVVGYGTQRKRDLTGSISSVSGQEIAQQPNVNPVSSLQGKVAGLTVVNSGRAGASPTVRIRGVNSTNNTDPLYVVDGIFQNNIDYLNPGDIESIEVLRDPSSIAIFGLQGGNGVIIVTTKRAAKGETRVNFQSNVGVQRVQKKIDVVDAAGFRQLYNEQLANLNAAPFDYTNYNANTDWQDLIFQNALITNNNLSISNSGEKTTTLVSIGYNEQEGVIKYDNYKKYIARLNQEIRITDNIKVGADLTGFHFRQQGIAGGILNNALWAAPIVPVQEGDRYYSMPSFQRAQVGNPVANINRTRGNTVDQGYRVVGSLFGEVKFLENFTARSTVYTSLGFNTFRGYTPLPFTVINLGEGGAPTEDFFNPLSRTSVSQSQSQGRRFQQDHTLTYNKTFADKHSVTALAGFTTLFTATSNVSGSRTDTTLVIPRDPNFWYLGIVDESMPMSTGGGGSEIAFMSFLGRINYAFNNKYLVNLSFRRDGSSIFAPGSDTRWGDFGSVGLGWVVSDESFFEGVTALDFLKLRGAWGEVGSALGFPANLYQPGAVIANRAIFGNNVNASVGPAYVPDPNLHWEVVRGIDLGLDLRAIDSKLSAEFTLYDRTTKDILTRVTLPGTAGDYEFRTNLGNISNRGIEVALGWTDQIGDFNYSFSPNFSYNKNNVESIGPNLEFQIVGNGGVNLTETGQSIGYFYGYRQTGIYQTTADMDRVATFPNSLPGDIAFEDVNGDGILSPADRTFLGTPFPKWNFGGNFTMGYKGFDASVDVQGVAGNEIYVERRNATFAVLNYEANRLNAWRGPGTSNVEPILDNTRGNNFLFSSYFLEPGDYFRFRNIQIGYTFGAMENLSKIGLKKLRLSLSGQNVATFSRTSGYTPEAPLSNPIASGADNGLYPVPATYSIGVSATF